MKTILIIAAGFFGFTTTVSALLFGASFIEKEWDRLPHLKKIASKKPLLFTATVISAALLAFALIGTGLQKEYPKEDPIVVVIGPDGKPFEKATLNGFEKELEDGAGKIKSETKSYFQAGEHDFAESDYEGAVDNYRKSIELIPTMSGYLNLGLSLFHCSAYEDSKQAYFSGLQIAHKQGRQTFVGPLYGNIGNALFAQGEYDESLYYHTKASAIAAEIGEVRGLADQIGSIAKIHSIKGRNDLALDLQNEALRLHRKPSVPT